MGKITILDEHVANQIAAGEVVERPASVVKELIENSIDANSTVIDISIVDGGFSMIKIKDNGEGIEEDDIEKAFHRHATSKIKTGRDLFKIKSLGFRGEALPSIAAVSRITLKTSTNSDGRGTAVTIEGGRILSKSELAFSRGTEITIQDLFFNTPARLKYLKSLQTELGHIIDYCNRLSLAYPNISLTLNHNDRNIFRTKGDENLLHTIAAIYGSGLAKNMIYLHGENLDFKVSGYISKPDFTRAIKSHISIFVNGRYVKNFLLSQSVIKGYSTLLMVNRFPIVVLKIELDPALVDVNVHPAKLEVRFSKEQELMKYLEEVIFNALKKERLIREPISNAPNIKYSNETQGSINFQLGLDRMLEMKDNKEQDSNLGNNRKKPDEYDENKQDNDCRNAFYDSNNNDFKPHEVSNAYIRSEDIVVTNDIIEKNNTSNTNFDNNISKSNLTNLNFEQDGIDRLPLLDPIAQFGGTYIIAQSDKGLYLIDQHAAHERIQYERNLQLFRNKRMISQELLIPFTLDYSKHEVEDIIFSLDKFAEHGITIEQFGLQTIKVRSIPEWIPSEKEAQYLERIIQMVLNEDEVDFLELHNDIIASTSCKSSIKANQYLTKREMESLIEQLRRTENPFSCPHGRPIIIHFSFYDIEKMFKRVV